MPTFDLTLELERLCRDIAQRVPELAHVDLGRVLVCVSSTRGSGIHGTYAKIHPLRFENGARFRTFRRGRRSVTCTLPTVTHEGREILYLVYFLVPRFLELPLREKLITVCHELYHISPACDGDLRRFPGKNYAHGSSLKAYNDRMATLVDAYLATQEGQNAAAFLEGDSAALWARHGRIVARKFPVPRLVPVR